MKISKLLILTALVCWLIPSNAQVDTSMTYADFLNQCRNFTKNPQQSVWVVSFWASYNTESLYHLPSLKESMSRYRNKPVRFIGISTDSRRRNWLGVLNRYNINGEQLWLPDPEDYDFLKLAFQHNRLPAIFVVEQQGQIRRVKMEDLHALVDALCEDLPNEPYYQDSDSDDTFVSSGGRDDGLSSSSDGQDGAWLTHTVRRGDTLYALQRKYKVPVKTIQQINGLSSVNRIKVGQVLKIKRM